MTGFAQFSINKYNDTAGGEMVKAKVIANLLRAHVEIILETHQQMSLALSNVVLTRVMFYLLLEWISPCSVW